MKKTFKDLEFKSHPVSHYFTSRACMNFENGYGISVINGVGAYCGADTFEVAVLYKDELCYNTHITDDVISYQTPEQITEIMSQIQDLKS